MGAKVEQLVRQFKFGDKVLDDPNPDWNTKQVIDFYTGTYPEMVNANLQEPEIKGNKMVYSIEIKTGTKG